MSASREKKNRQDLASQGIQDPKAIREAEEKAQQRKANRLYGAIAVVFVLVAALLFLLGLFIGRGTGGGPDDDGNGPDDRDDRPDRGGRDHREDREERRERRHPAPERSRPAPRIVPRQAEPVQQPAPKARDWKDFDIPLDDEPTVRPAPQPAAPDKDLLADTVDQVLADEPTPKDEEDVRTMSLEDLLKDIRSM